VAGEDRYQYELRWGPTNRKRNGVACESVGAMSMNDMLAIGAQLKRNVEERSSPASGPLVCDYKEAGV
jgi:hypothetical protein